jgi:hypothetical protein
MKTLTIEKSSIVSSNRVELGEKETWYRSTGIFHNSYKAKEPEVIIKDAPFLSEGVVIQWWRGRSDGASYDAHGVAITPDGKRYKLTGYGDVGIHTGHPPVLRPVMKKKWTLTYETIKYRNCIRYEGSLYEDCYNFIGNPSVRKPFVPTPPQERWDKEEFVATSQCEEMENGFYRYQKKVIDMVDTDQYDYEE